MSDTTGLQLAADLNGLRSGLPFLLGSGFVDLHREDLALLPGLLRPSTSVALAWLLRT